MKNVLTIMILAFGAFGNSNKILLKSIILKGFQYNIYRESLFSHDDNWNAEYFTIYLKGNNKRLCSSYLLAKRNDTTFIKGNYIIYRDTIEFTQHYYYHENEISNDSMKTIFYPDKNGKLLLVQTKEFKNGKMRLSK